MHKTSCFWKPFGSESVNESQKLLKSVKLSQKKSYSVRSEILRLIVNMLTTNDEYSGSYRENLPLPIQMQLSDQLKTFSEIFIAFLETTVRFKCFEKKDLYSSGIPQVTDSERCAYLNA